MLIDDSRRPLVFLRTHEETATSIELQFERLLENDSPFVLITDHSPDDHHHETPEERKQKALFFKRVRDRLRKLCRGMIVVEGDKPTPMVARITAQAASKTFGFSVSFVASEEKAVEQGWLLLGKDAAQEVSF